MAQKLAIARDDGAKRGTLDAVAFGALAIFCVALAAWRLACVAVGPDPDTDAYGHYGIARQMLDTPLNFRIHWVWLPFYHCLLALGIHAGATLDHVRSGNAVLATLIPVLLCWELRRGLPPEASPLDRSVPYLAALLAAVTPIAMQLGTTGQMEVFFSLLLVATAALSRRQQYARAAFVLSVAVLTRYEAWAVVVAAAIVFAHRRTRLSAGALGVVLGPAACVTAWATLRWLGGEPWFGFIHDNQAFAEGVLEHHAPASWHLAALGRYIFTVPARVLGVGALFSALGLWRALQKEGVWFVAPPVAVLGFLTLSSLTRSQLGLDRHFLAVVPFAATWAAHGVVQIAEWIASASLLQRSTVRREGRSGAHAFALVSVCVVCGALARMNASMASWREITRTALADARAAAQFLRTTPPGSVIVCDDASVEVLSGLDAARFVRARVSEGVIEQVLALSRSREVFVMSRASRVRSLARWGSVPFGEVGGASDNFMAVHVPARANQLSADLAKPRL